MLLIDLRRKSKEDHPLVSTKKKCGCECAGCSWEGRRVVEFLMNLEQPFCSILAQRKVWGMWDELLCPRCGGSVRYTYVPGSDYALGRLFDASDD